jgi:hypothetical protein
MWLKLRWARFFTLARWNWNLAPKHAGFDFHVTIPCEYSECRGSHSLRVRICEKTHESLIAKHEDLFDIDEMYSSPHPALFGFGPKNTHWQMVHGSGGYGCLDQWVPDADDLWKRAAHE